MTRQPNINSKLKYLSFRAKTIEDFKKVDDFKILCNQDGLEIYDLMSEAINLVFLKHHWPPGNPQTLLLKQDKVNRVEKCKCGRQATTFGVHLLSKKEFRFCSKCFSVVSQRHDPKVWHFNSDSLMAKYRTRGSKE